MKQSKKAMGLALIATGMLAGATSVSADQVKGYSMYRLYNPNSGEHFYTKDATEQTNLTKAGWKDEGMGWYAPTTGSPVYRLYNKNAGDHHYTLSQKERDSLVKVGWKSEGIGWYSESNKGTKLYRAYNPNAKAGSHNYTLSNDEQSSLIKAGWKNEGIAWYGLQPEKTVITGTKDVTINQTTTEFDAKKDVKATDFLGNDVNVTVEGSVDTKKAGVYTLTYKTTDAFGNTTTATRKVTVNKVADPTITGVKDTTMNQSISFDSKAGITAKDASGKALDVQVSGAIDSKKAGTYTLTYKATDAFGNATTATRKVTVNKVANPTITGVKDTTMDQTVTAFDSKAGITAKDASGKMLDVQVSGAIDTKKVGVYTLTYKATDAFGNATTVTRKVTVNKVANPTINGVKDTTMNQTVTAFDSKAGITAKDTSGKILDVQVSGAIDTKKAGVYTLTYKATDAFGNATTVTRKVTVNKVADPTITGVKDVTINKSTGMFDFDKGISAKDASGKALDITMQTNLTKENPKSGTYTVIYMATDTFGNSTSQKQTVMIVNDIKPVFTGVENAKVNITTGSFDVKSGVQATDGDGNVVVFDVTGAVDFTKPGNNELVYRAKDTAGNETTVKRNVEVFANSVEYIEITGSSSMHSNETTQLKAMVYPEDAWNKKLIWTSSNPEVATVNQDGQVQSLKSGFTKITVSSQNIKSKEFIVEIDDKIDVDFKIYGKNGYDKYFDTIHFDLTSLDTRKIHITNIEIWNAEQGYTYITDQDLKNKKIRTEIAPLENYSFEIPNNSFYPYGSLVVFYFETEDGIKLRESDIILR